MSPVTNVENYGSSVVGWEVQMKKTEVALVLWDKVKQALADRIIAKRLLLSSLSGVTSA